MFHSLLLWDHDKSVGFTLYLYKLAKDCAVAAAGSNIKIFYVAEVISDTIHFYKPV